MQIIDCYLRALQKAEENATNGGIKLDEARFVQLFNDEQDRLVRHIIDKKNEDEIRYLQKLLVYHSPMTEIRSFDNPKSTLFRLPDDLFAFSNINGSFKQGECEVMDFTLWEAKNENVHELLADVFNKPDFDFRETFYTVGNDGVRIYLDDFECTVAYLTYYRYPKKVDIEGYIKADGTNSTTIDPELDDKLVEQILNMVEKQFALNESEYTRYQFDSNNVQSPL